ncbi:alpha/beta hydrolase [Ornithinimicrobium ciconiae]|uniref:Alpha/beta hydrolase n=1 Tax=Ornithinimicrobium ciconiae TaxID=2594265 RepID=A0A516GEK1_9MICO|nr:alpha/beta hydrolase [Ornithinimicrobium ciconiae]
MIRTLPSQAETAHGGRSGQTVRVSHDVLTRPAREPDRTVSLGPAPHQVYDVWLAPGAQVTVVLVHGGFWRQEWDRTHLRATAEALAGAGYAVALPEYRRTGMPGGIWPGPGEDVAAALTAIRADRLLPGPTVLVGHSAGGHLAVWLLHRAEAAGVLGAVSLAGCLDLRLVGRLGLDDGAADALMGGTSWREEPALDADPIDLGPTAAPTRLLHGTADEQVPLEVSRSWLATAGTAGRDTLRVLDGTDHFDLIDPRSSAWPVLLDELRALTGREPAVAAEAARQPTPPTAEPEPAGGAS